MKEETLDRTVWRTCYGGGYWPIVRPRNDWFWLRNIL